MRRVLAFAFLVTAIAVYQYWHPSSGSELRYVKWITIIACVGQFLILNVRLKKKSSDLLDYPYYLIIGVGLSIAVSLNSDRLNEVRLDVATDKLNKHSDYILGLCERLDDSTKSPNLTALQTMCSRLLEELPRVNYWVGMTGTDKDFVTETEFPGDISDFHSNPAGVASMLDLRPDYLKMSKSETDPVAVELMVAAHKLRDLMYSRRNHQSRIVVSEHEYPSEISSWYLENWVYIVALIISLKLIKTTNGIFPGHRDKRALKRRVRQERLELFLAMGKKRSR